MSKLKTYYTFMFMYPTYDYDGDVYYEFYEPLDDRQYAEEIKKELEEKGELVCGKIQKIQLFEDLK